jgi:hypothetical protein
MKPDSLYSGEGKLFALTLFHKPLVARLGKKVGKD